MDIFGKVREEPQRQDVVAPSLRSEILLRAYLEEPARRSHCQKKKKRKTERENECQGGRAHII
jgi:hypothetical protein